MTAAQFRATIQQIGWTGRELGRRLGHKSPTYVSRMALGLSPVSVDLAKWLARMATLIEENPPGRSRRNS